VKMRTLRIGIVNVFCSVGVPIGTALSGVLFRELGFYGVYIIATVLYVFAFVYGMVFIKETKPPASSAVEYKTPAGDASCVDFVRDFFSLSHIKEAVRVTFKEGEHNRRLRIISLMVVVIVVMGPLHGTWVRRALSDRPSSTACPFREKQKRENHACDRCRPNNLPSLP